MWTTAFTIASFRLVSLITAIFSTVANGVCYLVVVLTAYFVGNRFSKNVYEVLIGKTLSLFFLSCFLLIVVMSVVIYRYQWHSVLTRNPQGNVQCACIQSYDVNQCTTCLGIEFNVRRSCRIVILNGRSFLSFAGKYCSFVR